MTYRMPKIKGRQWVVGFCLFTLLACSDADKKPERAGLESEAIFLDYRLNADEENRVATLRLQYLKGGSEGEAVPAEKNLQVWVDGKSLKADSSALTGLFYEQESPLDSSAAGHSVAYAVAGGGKITHQFSFSPIQLSEELPETLPYRPFAVPLKGGARNPQTLLVVLTDTSFTSADVNEELRVRNGAFEITQDQLQNLVPGPITLEVIQEEEKPLLTKAKRSGRVLFTYTIRRQFQLVK